MIPRKLALRNFMCYRDELPPLDFDGIQIACLSGENGAGKSALLDAMTWALWGEARLKSDDELIALGIGERTAREMDHLPVSGPDGSLERLAELPGRHRVYTHINNTNPMLIEDSPQRRLVERLGLAVGADGMRFTL